MFVSSTYEQLAGLPHSKDISFCQALCIFNKSKTQSEIKNVRIVLIIKRHPLDMMVNAKPCINRSNMSLNVAIKTKVVG